MTDTDQLLRQYTEDRSESAFTELVTRYVDLVYSIAVRRLGGDASMAEDAVQTVFTDLARKAHLLRHDSSLGGWLHRHTCFVTSNFLRAERRRQAHERDAAEMNALHDSPDASWQQIAPVLDEAIDGLSAPDREAVVLRFFENHDFRSVGAALGTNEDAAQKRVSRALEKLRATLAERGVALSLTGLTASARRSSGCRRAAPSGDASGTNRLHWRDRHVCIHIGKSDDFHTFPTRARCCRRWPVGRLVVHSPPRKEPLNQSHRRSEHWHC